MRRLFGFLAVLASLSSLSSVNAADTPLATLPEAPRPGKPFMIYYDAAADTKATWQAFYMGHTLDPNEFEAQGSWLKIRKSRLGSYMFVLSYGDKQQVAKTVAVTEQVAIQQAMPAVGVQGLPQAFIGGVIQGTPQGLPQAVPQAIPQGLPRAIPQATPQSTPMLNQPDLRGMLDLNGIPVINLERSPIDSAIYSSLRNALVSRSSGQLGSSSRETSLIAYAEALENVARAALRNQLTTPQINQEASNALRAVSQNNDQLIVKELESLLKTVALRFTDKSVEDSPADAILALVSLAAVLRDNPDVGIRRQAQPARVPEALQVTEASSMSTPAPCCQGGRFSRRR